jgi:hypothetical protein
MYGLCDLDAGRIFQNPLQRGLSLSYRVPSSFPWLESQGLSEVL